MATLQEEEDSKVDLEYQRMEQALKNDIKRCRIAASN